MAALVAGWMNRQRSARTGSECLSPGGTISPAVWNQRFRQSTSKFEGRASAKPSEFCFYKRQNAFVHACLHVLQHYDIGVSHTHNVAATLPLIHIFSTLIWHKLKYLENIQKANNKTLANDK